ncbi:MAG: MFS transporter [Alphaproteobacteria bacterium]|nr:MFS transporter [Alphaproteobacteria bacterium]
MRAVAVYRAKPVEPALAAADRASRLASLALALALPGDTVLYLLLPLYASVFGVTLPEAGLLLAANRFVRIAGYGRVVRGYERFGPRAACLAAAIGAAVSTLAYALGSGLWVLLAARLVWGLSFAALNIATQAMATAESRGMSRRSGRSRAIIAGGPMLGLVGGAVLADAAGPRMVFLILAGVALFALLAAAALPPGDGAIRRVSMRRLKPPAPLDLWAFVQGLTLDGIFVVGLSILAAKTTPGHATLAAGIAMALRYLAEISLGPPGGALAERWGARRSLIAASFGAAAALVAIGMNAVWPGVLLAVLLRGVMQPLPPPTLAASVPDRERVPAIAAMAMWRDLGAGAGPPLAGLLLPVAPLALYGGSGGLLAAATLLLSLLEAGRWRRRVRQQRPLAS